MKARKPMQSRQAGVNRIEPKCHNKNGRVTQKDAAGAASTSSDRNRELFERLEALLRIADTAFNDLIHPQFPRELKDLCEIVAELQQAIGKKRAYRAPFWNCVIALDRARPKLKLIWTLNKLVERACRLPPYPPTKLRALQKHLNLQERPLVDEIVKAIESPSDPPASNVMAKWAPVLERVNSPQCKAKVEALRRNAPHIMQYQEVKDFIAFTRWLDFAWETAKWSQRYRCADALSIILLSPLQNPRYEKQWNKVVLWPPRDIAQIKRNVAKDRAAERQRSLRLRQKENRPKFSLRKRDGSNVCRPLVSLDS